jgi:PRELI-like family
VISRDFTPSGSLVTTRLILKTATLPRWAPRGIISRSESWILEESEVDPQGKIVRCLTRNLDHVKAMQVHETQIFSQVGEGCVDWFSISHMLIPTHLFQRKTLQTTEARIVSGFGWGLTRQIENYGLARFRKNVQRVRLFRNVYVRLSSLSCSRVKVSLSSLT